MESRPEDVAAPVEQSVVDAAIYRDGRRIETPATVADTARRLRELPGTMAWIGLFRPAEAQLLPVAEEFGLHERRRRGRDRRPPAAQAGALRRHPVRRPPRGTLPRRRRGGRVRRDPRLRRPELRAHRPPQPDARPGAVRHRMEDDPELLALGPEAVLYAILDSVVDGYAPVVAGLQKDIDEIETQVFRGDPKVSRRIYELSRRGDRVPALDAAAAGDARGARRRASTSTAPTRSCSATCATWPTTPRPSPSASTASARCLSDILTVNATLVNQAQNEEIKRLTEASYAQNEEVKRISAWAAILFAPTLDRDGLRHELRGHARSCTGRSATRSRWP